MERKNTQAIITLTLILTAVFCICCAAAERELIAVGQCIRICVQRCRHEPDYQRCYDDCAPGCVPRMTAAVMTPSYYCNLGCALKKCTKVAKDESLLASCLDDCSTVQCTP